MSKDWWEGRKVFTEPNTFTDRTGKTWTIGQRVRWRTRKNTTDCVIVGWTYPPDDALAIWNVSPLIRRADGKKWDRQPPPDRYGASFRNLEPIAD
jgi:hypothetical protein